MIGYLFAMEKNREENIWSDIAKENWEGMYLSIYLSRRKICERRKM